MNRYHRTARNRETRTLVTITHGDDYGLDTTEDGPWYTVCEDHGLLASHPTLALAREHAAAPSGWCEDCRDIAEVAR